MYTADHAYKGVPRALLGHSITKQGLRPTFPPGTPFDYQFLACRCWETDPAIRCAVWLRFEAYGRVSVVVKFRAKA